MPSRESHQMNDKSRSVQPKDDYLDAAIRSGFSTISLTPSHRRIASYLSSVPEQCRFLSAAELADQLGVSQPSVTRFAQGQGFDGWAELRDSLRRLSRDEVSALELVPGWTAHAAKHEADNITKLGLTINDQRIAEIGQRLHSSRPLVVLGVRATVGVGSQFAWFASKLHTDVRHINDAGDNAFDFVLQAQQAGATQLVAFLLPRVPRAVLRLLRAADRLGLNIVLVAPSDTNIGFEPADRIDLPVHNELSFHTSVTATVVSSLVLQGMLEASPRSTQSRLEIFDQFAEDNDLFSRSGVAPQDSRTP